MAFQAKTDYNIVGIAIGRQQSEASLLKTQMRTKSKLFNTARIVIVVNLFQFDILPG